MSDCDEFENSPSKTQRKKEARAQRELGATLAQLPPSRLEKLDLPATLENAIAEYQRLPNSFGAKKRQLQYIGRIMRNCDSEAIRAQLLEADSIVRDNDRPILLQSYCQRIMDKGDVAINELIAEHPQLERQPLRQLTLACTRGSEQQRAKAEQRLYRYLQEHLE